MLRKTITVVVTGLLVAGCGSISASGLPSERATASSPSSTAGESASPTSAPSSASLFGEFDLGDGHKLHLECIGEGSPTIVIDVGNDDTIHGSWGAVFQPMSRISRTCAYDRANLGRSDPDPGPRTVKDLGDDLLTLLRVAKIPGPFVFVGGSFGGNIASVLAANHPEDVAGLVFIDSIPAIDDPALDPMRANLTDAQFAACCADQGPPSLDDPGNTEHIDFKAGLGDEVASVTHLPKVPTVVLTAKVTDDCQPDWPCDAIAASTAALEALWIKDNPKGTQVLVDSGHVVQREAPDAILSQTQKIVEAVRGS